VENVSDVRGVTIYSYS